jgi:hypothetical protein
LLDHSYSRPPEQFSVGGGQVQVDSPVVASQELAAIRTKSLQKKLGNLITHRVVILSNGRTNGGNHVRRAGTKSVYHCLNCGSCCPSSGPLPARVNHTDRAFERVMQQDWHAVRKSEHDRHFSRIGYDAIGLRVGLPTPGLVGAQDRRGMNLPDVKR